MKRIVLWIVSLLIALPALAQSPDDALAKINAIKRDTSYLYGIGNMYPYLRTSTLLNKYEEFNETFRYKIILFYPGEQEGNSFRLFSKLEDHHTYRAIVLMNE